MDKYLISGSLGLLILQVFVLMADLKMLPEEWGFNLEQVQSTSPQMGVIRTKHNNVRKKMNNSVYWEAGQENDSLHAYDSILTLNDSTAQIKLNNDVKINLHENTLIVIEPTPEKENANLVLMQFNKGRLRANTSEQKIRFTNKAWTIEASGGSEISLRSVNEDKVEIEVAKGGVKLENSETNEVKKLSGSQRIELEKDELKTVSVDHSVKWSEEMRRVIYTHSPQTPYSLAWTGQAKKLLQINPDDTEESEELLDYQTHSLKLLGPGNYLFRLEGDGSTSKSFEVSILKAPTVTYLAPLPRERILTDENVVFSWSPIENVGKYELEVDNSPNFENPKILGSNAYSQIMKKFEDEDHIFWRVKAYDSDGFAISPLYYNELFIVNDPLAAPKLLGPTLRSPASEEKQNKPSDKDPKSSKLLIDFGEWLGGLFFSKAEAQQPPQPINKILLTWSEVPGADHYMIEIADDPLFMRPMINEKVTQNQFEWKGFTKKKYYWRVAAGKNDKRGLFSEVSEFDVSQLEPIAESDANKDLTTPPVQLVTEAPKPPPKPIPPKPKIQKPIEPTPAEKVEVPEEPEVARNKRPSQFIANIAVIAQWIDEKNSEEEFEATFQGFTPVAIQLGYLWDWSEDMDFLVNFSLERRQWEVEDSGVLPFQEELQDLYLDLSLNYINIHESNYWGMYLTKDVFHERKAPQELQSMDTISVGPQWTYNKSFSSLYGLQSQIRLGFASPSGGQIRVDNWLWFNIIRHPHWGLSVAPTMTLCTLVAEIRLQSLFNIGAEIKVFW
ncbi:MAG: hypothetical protein R2827_09175 [Bdellovibrionales bacterium]